MKMPLNKHLILFNNKIFDEIALNHVLNIKRLYNIYNILNVGIYGSIFGVECVKVFLGLCVCVWIFWIMFLWRAFLMLLNFISILNVCCESATWCLTEFGHLDLSNIDLVSAFFLGVCVLLFILEWHKKKTLFHL